MASSVFVASVVPPFLRHAGQQVETVLHWSRKETEDAGPRKGVVLTACRYFGLCDKTLCHSNGLLVISIFGQSVTVMM